MSLYKCLFVLITEICELSDGLQDSNVIPDDQITGPGGKDGNETSSIGGGKSWKGSVKTKVTFKIILTKDNPVMVDRVNVKASGDVTVNVILFKPLSCLNIILFNHYV